jgi:hypothetical protein
MNRFVRTLRTAALTALVGAAVLILPATSVFAAPNPQTTQPPAATPAAPATLTPAEQATRLEQRLKNEQAWLTTQGNNLDRVNQLVTRAQTVIDRFKSRGVDVQALQTALDDFKATLPSAVQVHNIASGILNAHTGFDANGKVNDLPTARATVQSAYESLDQCRQILKTAVTNLRSEIRNFRQQHRPKPTPTATPGA